VRKLRLILLLVAVLVPLASIANAATDPAVKHWLWTTELVGIVIISILVL